MPDSITFLASIAPLQSACTISSDGGARIKIDIPESEIDKLWTVLQWRDRVLKVTIEPE